MKCFICNKDFSEIIQDKYECEDDYPVNVCKTCDENLGKITKVCFSCKSFRSLPISNLTNKYILIRDLSMHFPEKFVYICDCRFNYVINSINRFHLEQIEIQHIIEYLQKKLKK